MTIDEAIRMADGLKPNMYTIEQKVAWLNALDGRLFRDVILTHEHAEDATFTPYDWTGDLQDELIAPAPYDEVYRWWLESQIDLANAEATKYNSSSMMYNTALDNFTAWYNRTHMPIRKTWAIRI